MSFDYSQRSFQITPFGVAEWFNGKDCEKLSKIGKFLFTNQSPLTTEGLLRVDSCLPAQSSQYPLCCLPPEQIEQNRQHDAGDDHRGDRKEKPPSLGLNTDITGEFSKPAEYARCIVKYETEHNENQAGDD